MNKNNVTIADAPVTSSSTKIQESIINPTPYKLPWGGYFQAIGLVVFILLFLAGILTILKRKGFTFFNKNYISSSENQLHITRHLSISPKKSLIVVQFLNKQLLLGVTETSISLLSEESLEGKNTHEQNVKDFNVLMENAKNNSEESS